MSDEEQILGDDGNDRQSRATPASDEKARLFFEGVRERILHEELPVVAEYMAKLTRYAVNDSQRISMNQHGHEALLKEIINVQYRFLNLLHQLMGSDVILELLEQRDDSE